MSSPANERYAPPWIFGITNIPFGVAGTFSGISMPFFLRQAGLPLEQVAALGALAVLPSAYQLFWAPVLDLGLRRRSWLVLCAFLGSLLLGGSMLLKLPEQLGLYEVVMVLGQALVGLVASCNGALVSTRVDPALRGRAAGYVNAANLGASVLGGGLLLTLYSTWGTNVAALGLVLMIVLPSLAALTIPEPAPLKEPLGRHLHSMAGDVWRAVRSRPGWSGLVLCVSPVGTVAMTNLFSGLGPDYGVSAGVVTWVNGYGGGFITALGSLGSGFLLDRINPRKAYLGAGLLTAFCAGVMALGPLTPTTYIVGSMAYMLVAGLAYAAFSAFVYQIVGSAGKSASTLYSVFPAAGNQALTYSIYLDGLTHERYGARGVLWTDAGLNFGGVILLLGLMWVLSPKRKLEEEPLPLGTLEPVTA